MRLFNIYTITFSAHFLAHPTEFAKNFLQNLTNIFIAAFYHYIFAIA